MRHTTSPTRNPPQGPAPISGGDDGGASGYGPNMRSLLLIPLVACATLPAIRPCEPTGSVVDPAFVSIGGQDELVASIQYEGCEDQRFILCGIGDDWFSEDLIRLGVWRADPLEGEPVCEPDPQQRDQLFFINSLRDRYEDQFGTDTATVTLQVGTLQTDYSFAPDPD